MSLMLDFVRVEPIYFTYNNELVRNLHFLQFGIMNLLYNQHLERTAHGSIKL